MSDVTLDIKQLLQLIYLDVYEGVTPFIQYTRGEQGLSIRSVKIKAGNIPFDDEGKISVTKEVLTDPLLAAADAWQVEVVFGEDIPDKTQGIYNLSVTELFSTGTKIPCTLFHPFPVTILQNAGKQLTAWLKTQGISEIGHLSNLPDETFHRLMKDSRATHLLELRTKAKLLETSKPDIPSKGAGKVTLYDFARLSEREALTMFPAGTFDAAECRSVLNYLGLLTTCLDDGFLKKVNVDWLRG